MKISDKRATKALEKKKAKAEILLKDEQKSEEFFEKAEKKSARVNLNGALAYIPIMLDMVRSYIKGEYKDIPIGTIVLVVGALLYFVSPIDIISDPIPFIGYVDDASVLALCIKAVTYDLNNYKKWKDERDNIVDLNVN